MQTVRWDGKSSEVALVLDTGGLAAGAAVPVDVCFIIDTTGSMGDEISRIKSTLLSVTDKLQSDAAQGVDLRYGAVLYRDIGDEYVTRRHAFTDDLAGFDSALQTIRAAGGGDGPESQPGTGRGRGRHGLARRCGPCGLRHRRCSTAHGLPGGRVVRRRNAAAAVHRGIRVHTVAASGLGDRGSFAFRQIAQLTRGGSSASSTAPPLRPPQTTVCARHRAPTTSTTSCTVASGPRSTAGGATAPEPSPAGSKAVRGHACAPPVYMHRRHPVMTGTTLDQCVVV